MSITSQGQISIPIDIRRVLGLEKFKKAFVKVEDNRIIVEPIPDLLELGGSLKEYAIKGKRINEIIELEEKAMGEAIEEKYKKNLKKK